MAYVRPTAEDIDSWATAAPGWSWDTLEPFFRKSETVLPDIVSNKRPDYYVLDQKYHGNSGPVVVSWSPSPAVIDEAVVKAMGDVAVPCQHEDPYGGKHLGFSQHLSTVDRRNNQVKRSYAATGYLQPSLGRQNLHVLTEATACKIMLDMAASRATGVEFLHGGQVYEVKAKREVILSASSIQSPRLLELSGIGNPNILKKAGVRCLIDLPEVGENLHEHPLSVVTYELTKTPENLTLDTLLGDQEVFESHLKLLIEKQEGLLAGPVGVTGFMPYAPQVSDERMNETLDIIAASQLQLTNSYRRHQSERMMGLLRDPQAPVIQVVAMPCNFDITAGRANQSLLVHGPPPGSGGCYSVLLSSLYTMSRGNTHIVPPQNEGDLRTEPPEIDLAIMANQAEVDVLAAAATMADRAFRSQHLASRILRRVAPPAEVNLEDVTQARQYVQDNVMIFNHNGGTCAMGRVVDDRLRVKGVANLRVVDCSVLPDQIAANPLATIYALAERAANLIKEGH
jgi:choline dehydrogenase-like flavoprotein